MLLPQLLHNLLSVMSLQFKCDNAAGSWTGGEYRDGRKLLERLTRISVQVRNTLKLPLMTDKLLQPVQDSSLSHDGSRLTPSQFKALRILFESPFYSLFVLDREVAHIGSDHVMLGI